jgi:hypothetical protein
MPEAVMDRDIAVSNQLIPPDHMAALVDTRILCARLAVSIQKSSHADSTNRFD